MFQRKPLFSWTKYPLIMGSDIAGEIIEVGSEVTHFQPSDRRWFLGEGFKVFKLLCKLARKGFLLERLWLFGDTESWRGEV